MSLIYVNYAYAGWNSTTYVTEELDRGAHTVNRALMVGTGTVLILYLLLNATFLLVAPVSAMKGQIEIGFVVASHAFGTLGAQIMSLMLAIILISTLSSMILAGPRVLARLGKDYPVLKWLARTNAKGVPGAAVASQSILALLFVLTGTFNEILVLAGLLLGVSSFATVCAALWRRHTYGKPKSYRIPFYPLPPWIFLIVTGGTIIYAASARMWEGIAAIGMILIGLFLYAIVNSVNNRNQSELKN